MTFNLYSSFYYLTVNYLLHIIFALHFTHKAFVSHSFVPAGLYKALTQGNDEFVSLTRVKVVKLKVSLCCWTVAVNIPNKYFLM